MSLPCLPPRPPPSSPGHPRESAPTSPVNSRRAATASRWSPVARTSCASSPPNSAPKSRRSHRLRRRRPRRPRGPVRRGRKARPHRRHPGQQRRHRRRRLGRRGPGGRRDRPGSGQHRGRHRPDLPCRPADGAAWSRGDPQRRFDGGLSPLSRPGRLCATKAFVRTFTAGLRGELAGTGVTAAVCTPGRYAPNSSARQAWTNTNSPRLSRSSCGCRRGRSPRWASTPSTSDRGDVIAGVQNVISTRLFQLLPPKVLLPLLASQHPALKRDKSRR